MPLCIGHVTAEGVGSVAAAHGRVLAVATGAAVVAGLASLGVAAVRRSRAERVPTEWRQVGRLAELQLFPIKSGKPVPADNLLATEAGLIMGPLRDRVFVAVDRTGRFVSGRTHPRLVHVKVTAGPRAGTSTSPDTPDDLVFEFRCTEVPAILTLDPAKLVQQQHTKICVWGSSVTAVDCGDEAAAWIRKAVVEDAVHGEATAHADLRLAYFPLKNTDRNRRALKGNPGIYSDQTSYHLLTSSSLDALNAKLSDPVSTLHFRPNFVVEGSAPFEEDDWLWVRIGNKAVFRTVMPCGRCLFTTVDPETGIKSANTEPLKTLRQFRNPNSEQKKKMGGDSPMLGLRLGIHTCGDVAIGDPVYVYP